MAERIVESTSDGQAVYTVQGDWGAVSLTFDPRIITGCDLVIHRRTPAWPGHAPYKRECPYVGTCYTLSYATEGERIAQLGIDQGDEAMWAELERIYRENKNDDARKVAHS